MTDNLGHGNRWTFNDPEGRGNQTGGQGNFAIGDATQSPSGNEDTVLTSPVFSMAKLATPVLSFDTAYLAYGAGAAEVDLSTDGGQSWSSIWQNTTGVTGPDTVSIAVPQAAGQSQVRVRFHFVASQSSGFWEVDSVDVGSCGPVRGGLVAGQVSDASTSDALDGATVTSAAHPAETTATADSPGAGDGFYELFAAGTGGQQFTATDGRYTLGTATVTVAGSAVTRQDYTLQAGHITANTNSISASAGLGNSTTRKVMFTNDGTAPAHVTLDGQEGPFTPMSSQPGARMAGPPLQRIKIKGHLTPVIQGHARPSRVKPQPHPRVWQKPSMHLRSPAPSDAPWASIPDYPTPVTENAVAYDDGNGEIYSVGGSGSSGPSGGYAYDPSRQQWSPIADLPEQVKNAGAAFVGGTMYLISGIDNSSTGFSGSVYAYDPAANSWSQVATIPHAVYRPAVAVLDGQIYVVGGCGATGCNQNFVQRYDPASDTWTELAGYPVPVTGGACAGIDGKVICADGVTGSIASTYIYDPAGNTWTQGADAPYAAWGVAYSGANGDLQIANGITGNGTEITNQAAQYDPATNTWSPLPNTSTAEYQGGSACGLYVIGGTSSSGYTSSAEVLPGYDACGSVPWLAESRTSFDLAPGQSVTVTVTLNSAGLPQPGTYTASLVIGTDTPYNGTAVRVNFQVNPPKAWGKLAGTVTDAATGDPIQGATVQVCTLYDKSTGGCGAVAYTLTTDTNGYYQLWLNQGYNPLQVIAADDSYGSQAKVVKITKGTTTTVNFALNVIHARR